MRSWLQDHLHEACLSFMKTMKPCRPVVQRSSGADERTDVDGTASEQIDASRILAAGRARSEQRKLPADDFLQRNFHTRRQIPNQHDRAAFADAPDRCQNGFAAAHDLECDGGAYG